MCISGAYFSDTLGVLAYICALIEVLISSSDSDVRCYLRSLEWKICGPAAELDNLCYVF